MAENGCEFTRDDAVIPVSDTTLSGWYYRPFLQGLLPVIVMAHGYAAIKELYIDKFAEAFAGAGFTVLLYDHRNFGKSGGVVRGEVDPWQQVRDMRDVITWVRLQPGVDAERVGVWGPSYCGGHAIVVGALDRRVRCVVAQVPTISGYETFLRRVAPHQIDGLRAAFAEDRAGRVLGKAPATRPLIPEGDAPGIFNSPDAIDFFGAARTLSPDWRNAVTLRSVEMASEYDPGLYLDRVSPTPLLMVVAAKDVVTPTDLALAAHRRAAEPKGLCLMSCGHFDTYTTHFEPAAAAARDWFLRHLR